MHGRTHQRTRGEYPSAVEEWRSGGDPDLCEPETASGMALVCQDLTRQVKDTSGTEGDASERRTLCQGDAGAEIQEP